MPLGDSITMGYTDGSLAAEDRSGYRQKLYLDLVQLGYDIDFVGGLQHGQEVIPAFDIDHEGHAGWADHMLAERVYEWLTDNPADIVLLHAGTNQLNANDPDDIGFILDEIDRFNEDIFVIVARIINRSTYSAATTQFNDNVEALVNQRIAAGDKLLMVDQESALTYADDMTDNLHPNATGYEKMADVWRDAVVDVIAAGAPVITTSPTTEVGVGENYAYDVDAGGIPLPIYSLVAGPTGLTIGPTTGLIEWIPDSLGLYPVTVSVSNSQGTDTQSFEISVVERQSAPPTITSDPTETVVWGETYFYAVVADGYPVPTYSLTSAPQSMSINKVSGVVEWTPAEGGSVDVTVSATNDHGTDTQTFTIDVLAPAAIIDNVDTSFSAEGAWTGSKTSPYYYGSDYLFAPAGNGTMRATWRFEISRDSLFEVSAMWATYPSYRAPNAPYEIYNNGSLLDTVRVDQRTGEDRFNLLGIYVLQAGTLEVVLTNDASDYVTADAVMIRDTEPTEPGDIVAADFTAAPLSGAAPLKVDFLDGSRGNILDRAWDFDNDGFVDAASANPSHIYTDPGLYTVSLTVTGAVNSDMSSKVSYIEVTPQPAPPSIGSTPGTTAWTGELYTYDIDATGEPTPTYEVVTGPADMTINAITGLVEWTPSQTGDFPVEVRSVNGEGVDGQSYVITVAERNEAPKITSTPVTSATVGDTYTYTLTASGAPTPTFALSTGPDGMTLDAEAGLLAWTPSEIGDFSVEVSAVNGEGTDVQPFTIKVVHAPIIIDNNDTGFSVVGGWGVSSHSDYFYGTDYRTASAGDGSISATWRFEIGWDGQYEISAMWAAFPQYRAPDAPYHVYNNGTLLDTVYVDQRTGENQFNLLGSYWLTAGTLDVVLTNAASDYVTADAVMIRNTTPPLSGDLVSAAFTATPLSGTAPLAVTFTDASEGEVITWAWDFNGDGVVDETVADPSHTYNVPGLYTVSLTVTGTVNANTVTKTAYIDVAGQPYPPVITSTAVTEALTGEVYTYDVAADGDPVPTYELLNGPDGMTMNAADGLIEWAPSQTGSFPVEIRVVNSQGMDTQSYTITVDELLIPPTIISTPAVSTVSMGTTFFYAVEATGTPTPTFHMASGPEGMTLNASTGLLAWTPTAAGVYLAEITAENDAGSDEQILSITVVEPPTIIDNNDTGFSVVGGWGVSSHSDYFYGTDYRTASAGDGSMSATWRFEIGWDGQYEISAMWAAFPQYRAPDAPYHVYNNGTLLDTVYVDQRTGENQFNLLGSYWLTAGTLDVVLTNAASDYVTADAVMIQDMTPPLSGDLVSAAFTATPLSGTAPLTVTFTDASEGEVITWAWDFNGDGVVDDTAAAPSYTYKVPGLYTVSLTVTGAANADTETKTAYIDVAGQPYPPVITSTAVTEALTGEVYTYDVAADGDPVPTYELLNGPDGMTMNAADGLIEWTPSQTGSFPVEIRVVNSQGMDTQSYTITVDELLVPPTITSTPLNTDLSLGETYQYTVRATGAPVPTFQLISGPDGMVLDEISGLLEWTPSASGSHDVEVAAVSGAGDARQSFSISVLRAPVVLDNLDAGFSVQGEWKSSVHSDYFYGDDYRAAPAGDGSRTATWQFDLDRDSFYEVSAMWAAFSKYRAPNAPYHIYNNGMLVDTVYVDQRTGENRFNLLGNYSLTAGTLEVVLTNAASDYVTADAIQLQDIALP